MRSRGGWPVSVTVGLAGVGLLVAAPGPVPAIGAPAGISSTAGATVSVAGVEYTIVGLGTLGGDSSYPWGVNDQGQVAGVADTASGERRAFLWDPVSGLKDLGTLGGQYSEAKAVNDRGQVVGSSQVDRGHDHAFLWDPVAGMADLGTLGGHDSGAVDLNDRGQVVGWAYYTAEWDRHPFLWDPVAGMADLDPFAGDWSEALAVNDRGQVMGTHDGGGFLWDPESGMTELGRAGVNAESLNGKGQVAGGPPAFLWDPMSGLTQLGGLPGHGESWAVDVNDEGLVAGWSGTWDDEDDRLIEQRAWLWDLGTGMADLGTLGGEKSWAGALNERGQVAGSAGTASGEHHAFLWDPESGMTDLGALGGSFSRAVAMNDRGQVVGWRTDESGVSKAVLFTPSSLAPQVRVRVAKSRYGNKLRVNVNPDRIGDAWKFRVQKRTAGVWTTLPGVYRTRGTAETRTLTLGPGRFRVTVANRYGYTGTTSTPVRLTRKTARVHLGTDAARTRLRVNVDPNKGAGYWTFRVQRQRTDGTWRTRSRTYTTFGNRETRTLNLRKGTYRVKVQAKYGYRGTTSGTVRLRS